MLFRYLLLWPLFHDHNKHDNNSTHENLSTLQSRGNFEKKILYLIDQTRKTAYDYCNKYREESWKYDT